MRKYTKIGNWVKKTITLSAMAVLMAESAQQASASTYTWIGESGGNWSYSANWITDDTTYSYPSIMKSGTVVINTGGTVIIDYAGTASVGEAGYAGAYVQLSNGSVLELDGTRTQYIEGGFGAFTAGEGGGTLLLNGGWLSTPSVAADINIIVSGTESIWRAGHGGTPTIYGDLSGTGRLCTLSGMGTLYFAGSITPGAIGEVGSLEISYKYDIGHSSACAKDFGEDIIFNFDLGSTENYDQLLISQNCNDMTIHDLDLDNFSFNYLDGFGEGVYTLIDDFCAEDIITGSLGTNLTQIVGDYEQTLSLVDNDFILTVTEVPEPLTLSLMAGGVMMMARRRKKA